MDKFEDTGTAFWCVPAYFNHCCQPKREHFPRVTYDLESQILPMVKINTIMPRVYDTI